MIAYGQTGAGKTHTMGTGFEMDVPEHQEGMIPRALRQIFNGIKSREGQFISSIFKKCLILLPRKRNRAESNEARIQRVRSIYGDLQRRNY